MNEVNIGDRVTHCDSEDFPGPGTVTGYYENVPLSQLAMVLFDQKLHWLDENSAVSVTVKDLSPYVDPAKQTEPVNENQIKVWDRVKHKLSSDFPGEGIVLRIEKSGKTHVLMDNSPPGFCGLRQLELSLDLLSKVTPRDPFQVGTRVIHRYAGNPGTGTVVEVLSSDNNRVMVSFDKEGLWKEFQSPENEPIRCAKYNLTVLEDQSQPIVPRGTDAQATDAQATTSATSSENEKLDTDSEKNIRLRDSFSGDLAGLGSVYYDRRILIHLLDESRRETAAANNTLEAVRKQRDQNLMERERALIEVKAQKVVIDAMRNERDRAISRGVELEEAIRAAQNELDKTHV